MTPVPLADETVYLVVRVSTQEWKALLGTAQDFDWMPSATPVREVDAVTVLAKLLCTRLHPGVAATVPACTACMTDARAYVLALSTMPAAPVA